MTLSFALCLPLSLLRCVYFCLFCLFGHWMSVHACSCSETRMRIQAWAHKQLILYNIMYRFIYCACCACVYVLCSFVWLVDSIYIVCTTNRMAERSTGVWIARENSKKKRIHDAAAIHSTVNITDSMQFGWKFCPSEFIIKICLSEQLDNWTIIFKFMLHFRSSSKKSPRKKSELCKHAFLLRRIGIT